jgi:3-oxoacyl-[acyl-carrier-protein] synthase-3
MRTLGEPMEKAHTIMHKWGYTGSACLAMALHDARCAAKLEDGELIMFIGSGAGLAMGCLAMTWNPHRSEGGA